MGQPVADVFMANEPCRRRAILAARAMKDRVPMEVALSPVTEELPSGEICPICKRECKSNWHMIKHWRSCNGSSAE